MRRERVRGAGARAGARAFEPLAPLTGLATTAARAARRSSSASALALIAGLAAFAAPAARAELTAYRTLDEGAGTEAADLTGNHPATLEGPTWTTGLVGGALRFDEGPDLGRAQGPFAFSGTNEITIEALMRLPPIDERGGGYEGIVGNEGGVQLRLMVTPDGRPFYNAGQHRDVEVNGFSFEDEVWYHFALTVRNRIARVYVNGELVHEDSASVPDQLPDVSTFLIGAAEYPGWHDASATIDEVAIHDTALSEEELRSHHQAALAGKGYANSVIARAPSDGSAAATSAA